MKKNNLGAFYIDAAKATAAQDVMYKTMTPVMEKLIANQ
jgi:hypothetical protein